MTKSIGHLMAVFIIIGLFSAGCTPLPASPSASTAITIIPSQTSAPSFTPSPEPTATITPTTTSTELPTYIPEPSRTPTATQQPISKDMIDKTMAEMPRMNYVDPATKTLKEYPKQDMTFEMIGFSTVAIKNKDGKPIGYGEYYYPDHPKDLPNVDWYSLTNQSENGMIPMKLYSQESKNASYNPSNYSSEKYFGFAEAGKGDVNMALKPAPDAFVKSAKEGCGIDPMKMQGDEVFLKGIIQMLAKYNNKSEEEMRKLISTGYKQRIGTYGEWDVNQGIDMIWSRTFPAQNGFYTDISTTKEGKLVVSHAEMDG
jgi:hypothetical protein